MAATLRRNHRHRKPARNSVTALARVASWDAFIIAMKLHAKLLPALAFALLAVTAAVRAETTASSSASQSQNSKWQQMREQRLQQLDQTLHLTAEQKAKINAIWDQTAEDAKASLKNEKAGRRALRAERRERRQMLRQTHQQIREALTPEQQKLFDQMPRPARGAHPSAEAGDSQK
jgi:Spy/CpxP family protein refolding chaperone